MNIRRAGIVSLKAGSKASPNIKAHISGIGTEFELVTQPVTQPTEASDPELLSQHEAGEKPLEINGRGDRIRTCDIYVPNVTDRSRRYSRHWAPPARIFAREPHQIGNWRFGEVI